MPIMYRRRGDSTPHSGGSVINLKGLPEGARVLEIKHYNNNNPAIDRYLHVVLCKWEGQYQPYVTWNYNSQVGAMSDGNYFKRLSDAALDFEKRGIGWSSADSSTD